MSWFNSWNDFTKKASEVAKSASEKAAEAAKVAADKSKEVASTVHQKVNKFVEDQQQELNAVEQETDLARRQREMKERMMASGKEPWYIEDIESKEMAEMEQIQGELRLNILKLCEDEKNFLIKGMKYMILVYSLIRFIFILFPFIMNSVSVHLM